MSNTLHKRIVIPFALLVLVIFLQYRITMVEKMPVKELLYLPNEKLLRHFTGGLDTVIADLLWIHCLLYVGAELKGDFQFEWLEKMLSAVVQLDPYFREVYRFGGVFLSSLRADSESALKLLHRGMYYRPETWDLPYEAAMIYMLNLAEKPNSKKIAGIYLAMSASSGRAPKFIIDLAEKLNHEYDLLEVERDMWLKLVNSEDQLLRDIANRKLLLVEIKAICRELNKRLEKYKLENEGRIPENLEELGLAKESIVDPLGGKFFITESGMVKNTSVLDELQERYMRIIENGIRVYKERYGVYPQTLEEMLEKRILTFLPEQPYESREWVYNPTTGSISWREKEK
ncbi:MAG: hypothetical protein N3G21_04960 [Candidatus Hydrogenedentes bacterium]|nr:hypothetical protein [Candidatus Hydrogenedentota bacterium]